MDVLYTDISDKKRWVCLDYARVIAAFLVIYGHLYTPSADNIVRVFIYQFHLPLFFLISGMLHKYKGNVQFRKYFRTLFVPVITYAAIYYVISGLMYYLGFFEYKEALNKLSSAEGLVQIYYEYAKLSVANFIFGSAMLNGPCWFLIALLYCRVFADVFFKHKIICAILWILFFLLTCIHIRKYFFVANFVMAFPIYCFGYYAKFFFKKFFVGYKCFFLCICSFVCLISIMEYNGPVSMWAINYGKSLFPFNFILFYVGGMLGSIMVISLCATINYENKIVSMVAQSLLSILGLQVVFIFMVDNFIGYNLSYCVSFLIALVIMVLCVSFHMILNKYVPFLIGKSKS